MGFFIGVPLDFHIAPKQSTEKVSLSLVVAWLESPVYSLLRNFLWALEH